jgi:Fe-S cluster biogenesis protein NfuA
MEVDESINEILIRFRRSLKEDGGDIELVGIEDGVMKVRITRTTVPVTFSKFLRDYKTREGISCGRCGIPKSTIFAALELELKQKISGIKKVEVVK